jgi:hypothetical protein
VRNFDRLGETEGGMIVRPTRDHDIAIDPLRTWPLGDGSLFAPFIGFTEASHRCTAGL